MLTNFGIGTLAAAKSRLDVIAAGGNWRRVQESNLPNLSVSSR